MYCVCGVARDCITGAGCGDGVLVAARTTHSIILFNKDQRLIRLTARLIILPGVSFDTRLLGPGLSSLSAHRPCFFIANTNSSISSGWTEVVDGEGFCIIAAKALPNLLQC